MLETLRDYGRTKLLTIEEYGRLRLRHRSYYLLQAQHAESEWISPRQLDWIVRLERHQPNLRAALNSYLLDGDESSAEVGLRMTVALFPYWRTQGKYREGRHWLDRSLAQSRARRSSSRVAALCLNSILADAQYDFSTAATLITEVKAVASSLSDPVTDARVAIAEAYVSIYRGDASRARNHLAGELEKLGPRLDLATELWVRLTLGYACEVQGDLSEAISHYEEVIATTEACGEVVNRSISLWAMGVALFQQRENARALDVLREGLRLARLRMGVTAGACLEASAWLEGAKGSAHRAAILMGAAHTLVSVTGSYSVGFPHLQTFHDQCASTARTALGKRAYDEAFSKGASLSFTDAIAYGLNEYRERPASHSLTQSSSAAPK